MLLQDTAHPLGIVRTSTYIGRVGWGKEPPRYRLCAMNDLVHYLRYIPCVERVDVRSL